MATSKVVLRPTLDPSEQVPINLGNVTPDIFAGKSLDKINKLKIWHGNRRLTLNKVFEVTGKPVKASEKIVIDVQGDIQFAVALRRNQRVSPAGS